MEPTVNDASRPDISIAAKRRVLRIIWAAMLLGEILFLVVVAFGILPRRTEPVRPQAILVWSCLIYSLVLIPAAFAFRMSIFRRGRTEEDLIRPGAYFTGNVIFWASCEGIAFFGLVVIILTGTLFPMIYLVALALALQALTFPVSGKME